VPLWCCRLPEIDIAEVLGVDPKPARYRDELDHGETKANAHVGCAIERAYFDKGYRGHGTENPRRVFISGQKRGVFGVIKRELRRRSAIEPIIGHLKAEGHLGRCYLKGRAGDAANVILSAVGHNFRRILAWLREFLCLLLLQLCRTLVKSHSIELLNGRLTTSTAPMQSGVYGARYSRHASRRHEHHGSNGHNF
jgi:hypothetical protein